MRLNSRLDFSQSCRLTSGAAGVTTDKIERERTNCRIEQPAVSNVVIATPELDESVLNNVFRVGRGLHPLTGEQKQSGRNFRKADHPILMAGNRLHDLFTVFTFKTPPSRGFVCPGYKMVWRARDRHGAHSSRALPSTFLEFRAELDLPANLDERLPSGKPRGIPQKNSRGDCCTNRPRFANAHANKALL